MHVAEENVCTNFFRLPILSSVIEQDEGCTRVVAVCVLSGSSLVATLLYEEKDRLSECRCFEPFAVSRGLEPLTYFILLKCSAARSAPSSPQNPWFVRGRPHEAVRSSLARCAAVKGRVEVSD